MALVSSSVKPLAMRSITVAGRLPVRNSVMAVVICPASRPLRRGTGVATPAVAGWQPLQDDAPGGASAAKAMLLIANAAAAVKNRRMWTIGSPRFSIRRTIPPVRRSGVSQIVILQRQRPNTLAGCGEDRVAKRRRHHRHRLLAAAATEAAARGEHTFHLGHLRHAEHPVIVEIRLLDAAILDGDLTIERGGESIHDSALHLRLDAQRIDDCARIKRDHDAVHAGLAAA